MVLSRSETHTPGLRFSLLPQAAWRQRTPARSSNRLCPLLEAARVARWSSSEAYSRMLPIE